MSRRPPRAVYLLSLSLTGLLILTSGTMPQAAVARQATPIASSTSTTCKVAPRSTEEILTLAESTSGVPATHLTLPTGDPAEPVTKAAVDAVLREMAACLTDGDMLRFYALHSDDWLRRSLGVVQGMATLTTSIPPLDDGHRAQYLGPWHVQVLADGRVLAAVLLVVGDEPRPDPSHTRVLIFVHRDGRWLVDETIANVRVANCALPVEVAAVVGPPPGALFDSWSAACG